MIVGSWEDKNNQGNPCKPRITLSISVEGAVKNEQGKILLRFFFPTFFFNSFVAFGQVKDF